MGRTLCGCKSVEREKQERIGIVSVKAHKDNLMPTIFIPAPLRSLTHGNVSVVVAGSIVREAIEALDAQYPGVKDRLCEGDKVRPNISIFVDGEISHLKMREKLTDDSEVHFLIAISGGK